ncbi:MAG: hypothetical protein R3F59_29070 [Myxococcota bacterium]
MPLHDDFEREALYAPEVWYVHDVLELDPEANRVVAVIDTTRLGPIAAAQRTHGGHQPHLPGAVAIQVTGTLGNLNAVYLAGLRVSEGWCGYGTHVHGAKFPRMAVIGPPVTAVSTATRRRKLRDTWFLDYTFRFEQEGETVFESRQSAAWHRPVGQGTLDGRRER